VMTTVLGAPFDAVTVAVTTIGVLTVEVSGTCGTELDGTSSLKLEGSIDCPDEDGETERLELW
jgi:hypothetical protein